jgi:hypothetical protein
MATLSSSFDPTALNQYTSLPGQVYDADAMCKHILGSASAFCQVFWDTIMLLIASLFLRRHLIESYNFTTMQFKPSLILLK